MLDGNWEIYIISGLDVLTCDHDHDLFHFFQLNMNALKIMHTDAFEHCSYGLPRIYASKRRRLEKHMSSVSAR